MFFIRNYQAYLNLRTCDTCYSKNQWRIDPYYYSRQLNNKNDLRVYCSDCHNSFIIFTEIEWSKYEYLFTKK